MRNDWKQQILRDAPKYGIDPRAAVAVAMMEGLSGRVGDGGHAFGPFQMNDAGGVLTGRSGNHRAYAESRQGIDDALASMARSGAQGKHGAEAINAIVRRYERPAAPDPEVQGAIARYGKGSVGKVSPTSFGTPQPTQGSGGSVSSGGDARMQLLQTLMQSNAQFASGQSGQSGQSGASPSLLPALLAARMASGQSQGSQGVSGAPVHAQTPSGKAVSGGAADIAQHFIGTPYLWGGSKPGGFDCSGLLQFAYGKTGVNVPRTTYEQYKTGTPIGKNQLQRGDAVYFEPGKSGPGHSGMYLGNDKFIEAPHTGANVRVSTLSSRPDYVGARRFG